MVTYQIPDDLDATLQQAAEGLGRTSDDLLHEVIAALASWEQLTAEPALTGKQIARMKESLSQLDGGDTISSEQINRKFAAWHLEHDVQ